MSEEMNAQGGPVQEDPAPNTRIPDIPRFKAPDFDAAAFEALLAESTAQASQQPASPVEQEAPEPQEPEPVEPAPSAPASSTQTATTSWGIPVIPTGPAYEQTAYEQAPYEQPLQQTAYQQPLQQTAYQPVFNQVPEQEGAGASVATASPSKRPRLDLTTLPARMAEGFGRFPAAYLFCILSTVLLSLLELGFFGASSTLASALGTIGEGDFLFDLVARIALSLASGVPAAVATELILEARGEEVRKGIQFLAALIIAVISFAVFWFLPGFDRELLAVFIMMGIETALFALCMWALYTEENADRLFARVFTAFLYSGTVSSLLLAGVEIILFAFDMLLANVPADAFIITVIVCAGTVFPWVLFSQLPRSTDELESYRAWNTIVGNVILPLCLGLLAVLYGYIVIRVVLAGGLPSGQMNWFGSFALLVYLFLWLGLRSSEATHARIFCRWGWILLVPVVAVQVYGVYIRVSAYGLTALRYLSIVCTGVGILGLVLSAFNVKPKPYFLIIAIVALIVGVTPANPLDVANIDQSLRLRNALQEAGMFDSAGEVTPIEKDEDLPSEELRARILSSWDYLHWTDMGYIETPMMSRYSWNRADSSDPVELFGFDEDGVPDAERDRGGYDPTSPASPDDGYEYVDVVFAREAEPIPLAGFDSFTAVDVYADRADDGSIPGQANMSTGDSIDVDLSEFIEGFMRKQTIAFGSEERWVEVPDIDTELMGFELEDGSVIVFESLQITLEKGSVSSVRGSGYLLIPASSAPSSPSSPTSPASPATPATSPATPADGSDSASTEDTG
ncbi:MAG: DUF4153 domain-containing protein [Atopobiaceae bacterium]|nr:DUF4153 domain-containing protein [Atopobiaceae bacterium]